MGIYGLLEGNVIVPKLEPGVHHFHGPRWLLEWQLSSSRFDQREEQLSSGRLVCGEGIIQQMMGNPPSPCSLRKMDIL